MKPKSEGAQPRSTATSGKADLELAHEIHVLVWILQGQLAATSEWVASPSRTAPWTATPFAPALPGPNPDAWTVPAVWPCCP